ncbi:hypothetical protein [Streptomyces sp. NRRL S-350]|uniref:hypothetical protein n=1 Tax=Streptomyces sp. NRRL S-350 TaxID=1463902 RepID=UPI0004C12422|nr:hypothetical protein [Streptomyces sp. NRRL S-350]
MRAVRLASAVATAAVLLGAVTACGNSKGGNDAKGGDTKAGDAKGADPIAAALTADPKAALSAAALVMQKAGNGKVDMISPDDAKGGGTGSADWKDPAKVSADLVGDIGGKKLKIRLVGADAYFGGDDTAAAALGGKHWVKLPASNETGNGFRTVGQMLNPVVVLTVAAQSGKLSKVGQESLGGVQTTHFQAVEETSVLVAGMSALPADQRQAVQKTLEEDGKTLTFDFWLNGKQELVQYQEYGDSNGAKDAATVKYSDLGKAAAIAAPAAADLGSEADLLKLLG